MAWPQLTFTGWTSARPRCVCVCERDEGQRNLHILILQRRTLRRALYTFDRNPLLKNVSLLSVEAANAALLAYTPREHELAK